MARGAACMGTFAPDGTRLTAPCPLYGLDRGPVLSEIRPDAAITVIGEAPGEHEVKQKRPFTYKTGQVVDVCLSVGGVPRSMATVGNAQLCRPIGDGNLVEHVEAIKHAHRRAVRRWQRAWIPPDTREADREDKAHAAWTAACNAARAAGAPLPDGPPPLPVYPHEACRGQLEWTLAQAPKARVILAVGKTALEQLTPMLGCVSSKVARTPGDERPRVASIKKQAGAPVLLSDGRVLMATYHPAMAMPGRDKREWMPFIKDNLIRAARIAARGGAIEWSEPQYILQPGKALILATLARYLNAGQPVMVDIETSSVDTYTCNIRCVGLGAVIDGEEVIMVVPFRHKRDDTPWWSDEDTLEIALALRAVLEGCPVEFHHGAFDSNVLLRTNVLVTRLRHWLDTLYLHKNTRDNDLPHDLGFLIRRFFEAPLHKEDVDHKAGSGTTDWEYHLYCARDVLAQMRVKKKLIEWVDEDDTWPQFETDTRTGRIGRDMSALGLTIDEVRRSALSKRMNDLVTEHKRKFQALVGRPINPRSVPQLKELLYEEWELSPALDAEDIEGTRDEDDDDGEAAEGSTSVGALLKLQSRGLTDQQNEAIETLLELRAVDKGRGMVDNLPVHDEWSDEHGFAPAVVADVYNAKTDRDERKTVLPHRHAYSTLHAMFKVHVVPTGRIATEPNVQNWTKRGRLVDCYVCAGKDPKCDACKSYYWHEDADPEKSEWREVKKGVLVAADRVRRFAQLSQRTLIVAPPGHVLVGADYKQIELRLYAQVAQDQLILRALREGLDPHSLNAATLLANSESDLMAQYNRVEHSSADFREYWRNIAKRFAFLEIYGGEEGRLFSVMSADRDKATGKKSFPKLTPGDVEVWHERWHAFHPETRAWHDRCHAFQRAHFYSGVDGLDYRKRFFPGGVSKKNAVPNMTIQGKAASIANRGLIRLDEAIPHRGWSWYSGVVLQVHDFLCAVVPKERERDARNLIAECMYYEEAGMAYPVDVKAGHRLSQV